MDITDFINSKRQIALKLIKMPKSPGRTALIKLLKMKDNELIIKTAENWMRNRYNIGDRELPHQLIPKMEPDELFQWLTDNLKKAIK